MQPMLLSMARRLRFGLSIIAATVRSKYAAPETNWREKCTCQKQTKREQNKIWYHLGLDVHQDDEGAHDGVDLADVVADRHGARDERHGDVDVDGHRSSDDHPRDGAGGVLPDASGLLLFFLVGGAVAVRLAGGEERLEAAEDLRIKGMERRANVLTDEPDGVGAVALDLGLLVVEPEEEDVVEHPVGQRGHVFLEPVDDLGEAPRGHRAIRRRAARLKVPTNERIAALDERQRHAAERLGEPAEHVARRVDQQRVQLGLRLLVGRLPVLVTETDAFVRLLFAILASRLLFGQIERTDNRELSTIYNTLTKYQK